MLTFWLHIVHSLDLCDELIFLMYHVNTWAHRFSMNAQNTVCCECLPYLHCTKFEISTWPLRGLLTFNMLLV